MDFRDKREKECVERGRGVEVARKGIMGVVIMVMIGYLIMWIIMPTLTYKFTWLPYLRLKLNSTYFDIQGPQLLLYTFPVVFVAVLGSLYLHLGKMLPANINALKRKGKKKEKWRLIALATRRKPVIVRGALGIVTGVELSFLIMLLGLLIWSYATYLRAGFSRISPARIASDGGTRWKAKWEIVSYRTGLTGNICLTLLFFPVTRGSSILQIFGMTSERSIKYHTWLANLVVLFFTTHGISYILYWNAMSQISMVWKWNKVGVANAAGEITLIIVWIIWTTSTFRRNKFELFYYTHHLYILFIFFFIFHAGISTACFMLPGLFLFLVDRFLRFLQSSRGVRLLSARPLPACQCLELTFAKSPSLDYSPASLIFINVPTISKLQWHPFTVASSSKLEHDHLSVVIKVRGSWTKKVYDLVASSSPPGRLQVSVEGPYGSPSNNHFLRHETLVMVSGGSGITPFFSIIREILFTSTNLDYPTPKLLLICAFKNAFDLSMLDLLLPQSTTPFDKSSLDLKIKAYVTRTDQMGHLEADPELTQPQIVWFKPNKLDSPIYSVLGKNHWLWLGAVISSSFVGYLVFMGMVTRYYIYPIDKNTNKTFASSLRGLLNIFILCISITVAATGAMLWNKRRNAMEMKQITSLEGLTPNTTPNSQICDTKYRELKSLPFQSILESTEVHYGERPNLKTLLSDCKGSSVGVMVSGPNGIKREVAAICSSGSANNLHFESISFSW